VEPGRELPSCRPCPPLATLFVMPRTRLPPIINEEGSYVRVTVIAALPGQWGPHLRLTTLGV
jgi:hypothetical protein